MTDPDDQPGIDGGSAPERTRQPGWKTPLIGWTWLFPGRSKSQGGEAIRPGVVIPGGGSMRG